MTTELARQCAEHTDRFACADALLDYTAQFDEYGIIVHDGGRSVRILAFCPWCGSPLPKSKRDLWFEELARRGFTDPFTGPVPPEFHSDLWWRALDSPIADPSRFFLNVDLDIEAIADPAGLVKALEPAAYLLERPPGLASFELPLPVDPRDPEQLILQFVSLVNALPSDARDFWDRATRRTFDLRMQSRRGQMSAS